MLTVSTTATAPALHMRTIDLAGRVPASDPGGFKSVLYGMFPGAEVFLPNLPFDDLCRRLSDAVESTSLQFILLDLDQHPWLVRNSALLSTLEAFLGRKRVLLRSFGNSSVKGHSVSPDRASAIEFCLADWERALQRRFSW